MRNGVVVHVDACDIKVKDAAKVRFVDQERVHGPEVWGEGRRRRAGLQYFVQSIERDLDAGPIVELPQQLAERDAPDALRVVLHPRPVRLHGWTQQNLTTSVSRMSRTHLQRLTISLQLAETPGSKNGLTSGASAGRSGRAGAGWQNARQAGARLQLSSPRPRRGCWQREGRFRRYGGRGA